MNNTQQLPTGWVMKPLGELGKWYGGGTPSKDKAAYWTEGTIPWVSPKDMRHLWVSDAEDHITEEAIANSATNLIPAGSLLVVTRSGILRRLIPVAVNTVPVAINQDMKCLRLDQGHDLHYVLFCLRGFNQSLLQYAAKVGTTVESLEFSSLKSYKIPLPPLPEQRSIAAVLVTWDEAIQIQTKLLTTLRVQQRALRQQLLTGAKRLPGFADEWKKHKLSALLREVKRPVSWNDDETYELLSIKRRSGGVFYRESLKGSEIKTKNLRTAKAGDFLISKMQVVHGASGLVRAEHDGRKISGSYLALVAKDSGKLDINFFDFYSQLPAFYRLCYVSSYGVHIEKMTFDFNDFLRHSIFIPSLPEQQAIAAVLNTAAEEIRLREDELKALREQKRGLMQQLLTGQLRVSDISA
ncbi:restriction endonuclease subunit S [Hymenobacter jeollabukensis]|uniref:Restriction endonuclease subunit S n=1 Tax=Hymenobacter jeollabukensis TaxID=2025313 RepID=A0A5R8WHB1_9BACT|nr:restriction endonuclease subunit S [Hymenobacter jeollabukensis]TLM87856.1 restriction endonuclease subunit S [Hymenobacter jeollabukensis]